VLEIVSYTFSHKFADILLLIVPFVRQSFDPGATGFSAVQWDTATLKQITVTKEMNYDDAFIIEEVVMVTTIHILSTVIG